MKKIFVFLAVGLTSVASVFAQGAKESSVKSSDRPFEGQTLTISTWGYNMDILEKNLFKPFEEKYGVEIVLETGNNSDRFTKLVARKDNPLVDVVQFAGDWTYKAEQAGIIQPYDESIITNLSSIMEMAKDPNGNKSGIGYAIGNLSLAYRTDKLDKVTSWRDLSRADVAGYLAIPQLTTTYGPYLIYMLTKAYTGDFKDLEVGWEKLEELAPSLVTAYGRSSELNSLIAQEEVYLAPFANFSWGALSQTGLDLEQVIPEEGLVGSFSVASVVANTKNTELANLYLNHLISYEVQMNEAMDLVDSPVRTDIELPEEIASQLCYGDELINSLNFFDQAETARLMPDWVERWNKIFTK